MRVLVDLKQMKVGCVLIAAAYGADTELPKSLDTKHWITYPTPDLKIYEATAEQVDQLKRKLEQL